MSATDELRRMLDERGVEWWEDAFSGEHRTVFDGKDGVRYCVYQLGCVLFISSILPVTPEQAIAATLGSGRLTAEQVREAAELHSREYQSPTDPYVYLTEYDWQAIADELNAELGWVRERTCTNGIKPGRGVMPMLYCSNCGCYTTLNKPDNATSYGESFMDWPFYCGNCGSKVVSA